MQIFNAGCSRDCLSDRRRNETLHHLLRRTRIAGIDYNRCAFHVGIFPHLQREERRTPGQENQEADNDREYRPPDEERSEEHTSELQSLMRISYAVFRLKNKKNIYRQM